MDDAAGLAAALVRAAADPAAPVGAQFVHGGAGEPPQLLVPADRRAAFVALAQERGVDLLGRGRYQARLAHAHVDVVCDPIPARAVAASLARVLLDWDAALAAGEPVFDGIVALAEVTSLLDLSRVPDFGYHARYLGSVLAEQTEPLLLGTGREPAAFGTDPPVDPGAHELLTVLLSDRLADASVALAREVLWSSARAAMRACDLVEAAWRESGVALERVPRSSAELARARRRVEAARVRPPAGAWQQVGPPGL